MTHLVLVRHGETDWNVTGRFQGQADPPLNANGREQARALAEQLALSRIDAIYSSDLQRAYDTARIVADRVGLTVIIDPRLREVSQGAWEGVVLADILARYPREWAMREQDPLHSRPPGGESVAEVAQRASAAADAIAIAHPNGRVVVVTHGLTQATLMCLGSGLSLATARSHIQPNATLLEISWPTTA
jgi:broad specificity phosphatase PhoE